MTLDEIKQLIDFIRERDLSEFELERADFKLRIKSGTVVQAVAVPAFGPAPLSVVFHAGGSYDPDGFIGNIKWTFHDGSEYWGATAYNDYPQNGTFPVTLTVFDANGATGTHTIMVQVGGTPPPPTPSIPQKKLDAKSDLESGR